MSFFQVTPDLIKSQTTSAENGNGEDSQTKQAIYNILKEGYDDSLTLQSLKVAYKCISQYIQLVKCIHKDKHYTTF